MTNITEFVNKVRIPVEKRVRQGVPLLSKLFNACLEMVFYKMNWEGEGSVNDELFNYSLFADDIVLILNNAREKKRDASGAQRTQ